MRVSMKKIIFVFCLFAAIAANAKEEPVQLFPRTYGYFSKGDSETCTITYNHAYGSTVGRILRIWIFLLITILYWR